jgi:hypothetical protein
MSIRYEPACVFCRANAAAYYITCQGCQERRRKWMEAFHAGRKDTLPYPSSPHEPDPTRPCPWCGAQVPEDQDCPQPSTYCDHS